MLLFVCDVRYAVNKLQSLINIISRSQVACVIFKRQSEVDKVLGKEPKREDKKRRRASPPKETVEELGQLYRLFSVLTANFSGEATFTGHFA